jgi:hypothetical protein
LSYGSAQAHAGIHRALSEGRDQAPPRTAPRQ